MPTILIKNVPEDTLKELKRLKVELGCKTWADLLSELTTSCETASVDAEQKRRMRKGVERITEPSIKGYGQMGGYDNST